MADFAVVFFFYYSKGRPQAHDYVSEERTLCELRINHLERPALRTDRCAAQPTVATTPMDKFLPGGIELIGGDFDAHACALP
jgi:hypothetical protein